MNIEYWIHEYTSRVQPYNRKTVSTSALQHDVLYSPDYITLPHYIWGRLPTRHSSVCSNALLGHDPLQNTHLLTYFKIRFKMGISLWIDLIIYYFTTVRFFKLWMFYCFIDGQSTNLSVWLSNNSIPLVLLKWNWFYPFTII